MRGRPRTLEFRRGLDRRHAPEPNLSDQFRVRNYFTENSLIGDVTDAAWNPTGTLVV